MPTVTVEYYGVTGTGRNVTEAKRDAGEQIRKALDGDYYPCLIRWGGYLVLCWREPKMGWGYKISHPQEQGYEIRESMWLSHACEDREQALTQLAHHIGDIARPFDENPQLTWPLFESLCRRNAKQEFASFCENMRRSYTFQARYRCAKDKLGMTDNDCHDWAGMNPSRHELWKDTEDLFRSPSWETGEPTSELHKLADMAIRVLDSEGYK